MLSSFLFRRPPQERESPVLRWPRQAYLAALALVLAAAARPDTLRRGAAWRLRCIVFTLPASEFLPELDEGDIWLRVKFPVGISLEGARPYVREIRERLLQFPETRVVVSQLGAPTMGQTPTVPDNAEFFIGLKPREEWKIKDRKN